MIKWFIGWYDARRRALDMEILWPTLKSQTDDINIAKAAFYYHMMNDRAWTRHYTTKELVNITENLL